MGTEALEQIGYLSPNCLIVLKARKSFHSDIQGLLNECQSYNWSPILVASDKVTKKLTKSQRAQFCSVLTYELVGKETESQCWTDLSRVNYSMIAPTLEQIFKRIAASRCRLIVAEEPLIYMAALFRSRYGIPGLQLDQVLRFTNKVAMKRCIIESNDNLQSANWCSLVAERTMDTVEDFEEFLKAKKLHYPIVLKPQTSCGSFDVKSVRCSQELSAWLSEHKCLSAPYLAEEELTGRQYAAYMMVFDDQICWSRLFCNLNPIVYFVQRQIPLVKVEVWPLAESHQTFLRQFVKAFSPLPNGMVTVEYFVDTSGNFKFLETCIRLPGGPLVEMVTVAEEQNLEVVHLLGQCCNALKKPNDTVRMAYIRYPTRRGVVEKINQLPDNLSSQTSAKLRVRAGEQLSDPVEVSGKYVAMELMLFNKNYLKLNDEINFLANSFEPFKLKFDIN